MKGTALRLLIWMTVLTGVIYPLTITGIAKLFLSKQAMGSFVYRDGKAVGSALIGQKFSSPKYFWGRPSAVDYNTLPSGGSNLGPTSAELKRLVNERKAKLMKVHDVKDGVNIPSDLLFASGSGIDPHISPEAAYFQLDRIAKERGFKDKDKQALKDLIDESVDRKFKFLGPSTVNVLQLNLSLDKLEKSP